MDFNPYPHQAAGVDWIVQHDACALFWGMGSGKTVTTLTALDRILFDLLEDGPVLIIAPLRVAQDTWSREMLKWDHLKHLRISRILGTEKQRRQAIEEDADIYVTNRENVVWLVELLEKKWPFKIVIIDELSGFKSTKAKRWRALRRVRGRIKRIVGLTGTPRPNGLEDLWPEIYLLDRGERLGRTLSSFRSAFLVPDRMNGHVVYQYRAKQGAEDMVYDRLSDICMSVKKEDVISLPGQVYEDISLELPKAVLAEYKRFEKARVLEFIENESIMAGSAAALTNKLLQFANGAVYDENRNVHKVHDVKLDALEELIEAAGGDPVLVFYSYKHDADRIKERIPCRQIETEQDIREWNAGEIPVAIAHPASIGHGLNLQDGGHIIIWFGLTWSLELYQQANERLNRPGQKSVCIVYHLIVKGTHDERVLQALSRKEEGQSAAIEALKLEIFKGGLS